MTKNTSRFGKKLPRHEETGERQNYFTAQGKTYYIFTEKDVFPMARWGYFRKFAFTFMANADFSNSYIAWDKMLSLCNDFAIGKSKYSELILNCEANKEEIKNLSEMRYDTALYLITLFIVTDGENVVEWTVAQAEEKIEAWKAEGYGIEDFFLLATAFITRYNEKLLMLLEQETIAIRQSNSEHSADTK